MKTMAWGAILLENAYYKGIDVGGLTLKNGLWKVEPYMAGSAVV